MHLWTSACWTGRHRRDGIWLTPTGDGRLAMATPDGLWAVLTIFEIGQLRDALRQAAFALHRDDVDIEVLLGLPINTEKRATPEKAPKRVLVVIADHGRSLKPPPEEVRRAS
jgi:hypothetical protein